MPRAPQVSRFTASLSDQVYSGLAARAAAHPGPVYRLHVGDTYLEPPEVARAEAQRSADHPRLHNYANVVGEPELIDAIVEREHMRFGRSIERSRLQITLGATGGLSTAAAALLEPGDEVLLLAPYWPLIRGIVAARGAKAVDVPFYDRAGRADFDPEAALRAALTERTVALYMCSPSNPTGRVHDEDTQRALCAFAERHDLWIWSDEAYEDLAYVDAPTPARTTHPKLTLSSHTVSKSYGLAGARVGWLEVPESAAAAIRGSQTFLTYCAPRPMQFGAAQALRHGGEWQSQARKAYRESGAHAAEVLGLPSPQGGTFMFFDVSPWLKPGEDVLVFLERALAQGVLLTPGGASGSAYASWVRMCFTAVPPTELSEAVKRLSSLMPRG
ncbi:MAG: pyridoxal phosphate-dependent aminotransferase [Polyangiaceae bacterium]